MRALCLLLLCAAPGCKGPAPADRAPAAAAQRWYCPMHPSYVSDRPGDCPICNMKLVPMDAPGPAAGGPAAGPAGLAAVTIDPQRQQLIALRTVPVRRAPLSTSLRTTGRVTYDETRVHHVHARFEAYVERLYANFTGKYVRRGEPLVSLYSPELFTAEQEYLLALRTQKGGGAPEGGVDLVDAARQKLLLWNIPRSAIAQIEQSGRPSYTLDLLAPMSGYVIAKTAVHGMRVRPEDSLFDIVDLSRVWVLADVYEYELPRIRLGQRAEMTLSYWPERRWQGRLTYIYPAVDPKTRTVKVRLEVDNTSGDLRAEMFADVVIEVAAREALVVPEDAVLQTGARQVVFLSLGQGRLLPREVRAGTRAGGLVEIRAGLAEGDEVAAGASFLLDSESQLQAALQALGGPPPGEGHGGHRPPAGGTPAAPPGGGPGGGR